MKINQLKAGVILSYFGMITQNLISIVYTPIMLRLLGQNQYGLYNLVYSVVSYLGLFSFGFGSAYVRYYSKYKANEDEESVAKVNGMFLTIFSCIAIITIIMGYFLIINVNNIFSKTLSLEDIETAKVLITLMVMNVALSFISSVFDSNIMVNEKYVFQKVVNLLKSILNPFLTLPLLLLGYKSISLVLVTTFLTILSLLINIYYCFKKLKISFCFRNFDFNLMKEMSGFSFFIFLNMIVDQINWSVDKFLLGMFSGTLSVAIYSVGGQINSYYLNFSTAISSVFIPKVHRLVEKNKDNQVLSKLFTKVGRLQFIILSFILSGFYFFGQYFIQIWAGEGYSKAYYIALILIIPVTIPLIQNLGIEIQRAKNLHKFRSIVYFFIAIGNVLISIPLCKSLGGIGVAIGTAISLLLGNGIVINIYYHYKVGLNIKYFWKEILKITPALIPSIILGCIIKYFIIIDKFYIFFFGVVIYSIVFGISMWNFGMNNYEKNLLIEPLKKINKKVWRKR